MPPAFVLWCIEGDVQERPPLWSLRFPNQRHLRFLGKAITFQRVTRDARANDILPGGRSTAIAWNHVIEIQIVSIKSLAAVLAGVFVPLEHIVPGKLHFLLGKTIEEKQHNHARDSDFPRNRLHQFVVRRVGREIAPAFKIVGQEIIRVIRRNNVSVTGVDQREGAPGRTDVDRLPETVQHQYLTI